MFKVVRDLFSPLEWLMLKAFQRREGTPNLAALNSAMHQMPVDETQYSHTDEYSFVLKNAGERGVGVFTTHAIAKGTYMCLFPILGWPRFLSNRRIEKDPRIKKFAQLYGVKTGLGVFVAFDFSRMSVGWYLNHSDTPNAYHQKWMYYASRDIAADEEVTIDYRTLW